MGAGEQQVIATTFTSVISSSMSSRPSTRYVRMLLEGEDKGTGSGGDGGVRQHCCIDGINDGNTDGSLFGLNVISSVGSIVGLIEKITHCFVEGRKEGAPFGNTYFFLLGSIEGYTVGSTEVSVFDRGIVPMVRLCLYSGQFQKFNKHFVLIAPSRPGKSYTTPVDCWQPRCSQSHECLCTGTCCRLNSGEFSCICCRSWDSSHSLRGHSRCICSGFLHWQ